MKTAIAAAALGLAFGAQAVSLGGATALPTKYAVELFSGSAPETAFTLPTLKVTAATAIPAGSTVTVHIQFTGGRPVTQPAGTSAAVTGAGSITATLGSTLSTATTAALGNGTPTATTNNADVLVYKLVTDTSIGIGGDLLTITGATATAAGLATVGQTLSANVSLFVGNVAAVTGGPVPTTGTLEASSGNVTVATSVQGVTMTSTTGGTTQKVDVSAATPSALFTTSGASDTDTGSTTTVLLGTLGQVNGSGKKADGTTAYAVASKPVGSNTVVTITAPAGYFAALGTTGSVGVYTANANACAGAALVTSTAFATKAAAAAATKITLASTSLGNTTGGASPAPHHICMTVDGSIPISTGAASIAAVLGGAAAAQDAPDSLATTSLTSLDNNGSTIDVPSYFPAALSQYGYSSYVRVVNKGAVSAPVSIAIVDPASGVAGTAKVIGTIAAGAATTFTGAQVEALIGTQDKAARPRLRLTAPTGKLQVQSFVQSANGTFTEVSGGTSN